MHNYLESVGFRRITSHREMDRLMRDTVLHFDRKEIFKNEKGRICGEFSKDYAPDMGLTVCGEFEDGDFRPDYTFPFFNGATISMNREVDFERHAGEDSYAGACEDPRIGATIIFYLNNVGQYRRAEANKLLSFDPYPIKLSALAREGTVLLPVYQAETDKNRNADIREAHYKLISEARGGDEAAIEALTTQDMEDYSVVSKRIRNEDVFSIVDTCFLPYGIECDQYNICGNILSCERVKNVYTSEFVYQMQLEVCDLCLDVCINEDRIEGVPRVGRRLRALVWLQGLVHF